MDETLLERVNVLEDENIALNQENEAKKQRKADIEAIHLEYTPLFPKSAEQLGIAGDSADRLAAPTSLMEEAKKVVADASARMDDIAAAVAEIRDVMTNVHSLNKSRSYDQALSVLATLGPKVTDKRFEGLAFVELTKEIIAYDTCAILTHKAEDNIANDQLPLVKEDLDGFINLAEKLTTFVNPSALREAYIDESYGLYYCYCYRSVNADLPSLENFRMLKEAMAFLNEHSSKQSALTAARAKRLRDTFVKVFNRLSYEYFENEPNYDKAVEIFQGKDLLLEAEIEHYAYKNCLEERDFYFEFVKSSALKKSPTAFKDWVLVHGQKAAAGDELSFLVLAHVLSMPLLDAAKFNTALRAISGFDFVQMLAFLEAVVRLGIDREKAALVFDELSKKKREGDLEKMAPSLNYLNFHIDASLRDQFNSLRLSLMRSPKAHKVKIKSNDENVHLVFGEEKDSYPAPVGKPLKDQNIKAWGMFRLILFWIIMAIVPVAAAAGLFYYFYMVMKVQDSTSYLMTLLFAVPLLIVALFIAFNGIAWTTRDEWESARFRRVLFLFAILEGAGALVYFALPDMVTFLKPFGLALFAASLVTGVLGLFMIKERKRPWRYVTLIPWLLIIVATAVFFILLSVNGKIVFA